MDNQTIGQGSPTKRWYLIGLIVVLALALWYFYGRQAPSAVNTQSTAVEQTQLPALSEGDTTEDILSDLNQALEEADALNADAAASAQAVEGF